MIEVADALISCRDNAHPARQLTYFWKVMHVSWASPHVCVCMSNVTTKACWVLKNWENRQLVRSTRFIKVVIRFFKSEKNKTILAVAPVCPWAESNTLDTKHQWFFVYVSPPRISSSVTIAVVRFFFSLLFSLLLKTYQVNWFSEPNRGAHGWPVRACFPAAVQTVRKRLVLHANVQQQVLCSQQVLGSTCPECNACFDLNYSYYKLLALLPSYCFSSKISRYQQLWQPQLLR